MLAILLNMSFANRIEKGQFIPRVKAGGFLAPGLNYTFLNIMIYYLFDF